MTWRTPGASGFRGYAGNQGPRRAAVWLVLCILMAGGCASSPVEREAIIVAPTDASRDVLARVVATALDRDQVMLSPDALTRTSLLVIEPIPLRTIDGLVQGYRTDQVHRFRLLLVSGECVLEALGVPEPGSSLAGRQVPRTSQSRVAPSMKVLESQQRWLLPDIQCRPADGE
jgi:hypothetical protein